MPTRSIGQAFENLRMCFPLRFTTGSKPFTRSILLAVGPDTPDPDMRAIFEPPTFLQKGLRFCSTMAAVAAYDLGQLPGAGPGFLVASRLRHPSLNLKVRTHLIMLPTFLSSFPISRSLRLQ